MPNDHPDSESSTLDPVPPLAKQVAVGDAGRTEAILRTALPACQPQEGSIGSQIKSFTRSELAQLKAALPTVKFRPRQQLGPTDKTLAANNLLDICQPWEQTIPMPTVDNNRSSRCKQKPEDAEEQQLDFFGAPRFATANIHEPRQFRLLCRDGFFSGPTNGQCPGFLQCNLVVLPQGQLAFDFLLFCQRNPKACPLIEVCDIGSPHPIGVARGADLRTDLPK